MVTGSQGSTDRRRILAEDHLRGIRNRCSLKTQLERLIRKLPAKQRTQYTVDHQQYNLLDSQIALRQARNERYQVIAKASEFRKLFLQEQAAAAALAGDEDKERILERLLKAQERSDMYRRLHHVFKPNHAGAISHLEIPAAEDWKWPYDPKGVTQWKREYDTQKVENLLFTRNILHFGQSKETPWALPPFNAIPFTGTGKIADEILDGTF
jgi:hypothetical protein